MTCKSNSTKLRSLALPLTLATLGAALAALQSARAQDNSLPALPSPQCDSLQVPAGNSVVFHVFAVGVQIYQWSGSNWVFVAPAAQLFADPGHHGLVGIHYAGPTWETKSGSKVIGMRKAACTPDSTAIPWLKLAAASSDGPGVLDGVTYIQRVNTIGGIAPASAGTVVGQEADVPYMAEYYFYKDDAESE